MLVSIHFPIADLRGFLANAGKLALPTWPVPSEREFVRSFGPIVRRQRGGIFGLPGEDTFCDAHRAVRFHELPTLRSRKHGECICLNGAFRRFYFDGEMTGRFEIGVTTKPANRLRLESNEFGQLLQKFLDAPISVVQSGKEPVACKLSDAGVWIARSYRVVSSETSDLTTEFEPDFLVSSGEPVIVVTLGSKDKVKLPSRFQSQELDIAADKGLSVRHAWLPSRVDRMGLWVLSQAKERSVTRSVRVRLVRLHQDVQCMSVLLRHLSKGHLTFAANTAEGDSLWRYLDRAKRLLEIAGDSTRSASNDDLAKLVRLAVEQTRPGWISSLHYSLERSLSLVDARLRRDYQERFGDIVERKQINYMGETQIGGPQIEGKKIVERNPYTTTGGEDVRRLYTVWYGTNRKPIETDDLSRGYSGARGADVSYGTCTVAIPKSHMFGSVGSSWLKRWLTFKDDRLELVEVQPLEQLKFWTSLKAAPTNVIRTIVKA